MADENGAAVDGEAAGGGVAEAVAEEARGLGEEERWEEARDLLAQAIEEHGDHALLLCWLGIATERLGEEGAAYEYYRAALALQPTDPFVLAAAGSGAAAFDDPEAEGALRLAALTAPDFPFARASYGAYLAREGLFAEAAAELEAARDLSPDDGGVRAELAFAYLLAGRSAVALVELEEALSQLSDDAWLRGVYGLALLEARRGEEGAEQLHRASTERPEDVELQLAAALAAAAEGWEDEGWNALARAEAGADSGDRELIREVEEALGAGMEAAEAFLRDELAPPLLRERLLQRG
jgi:tetratricopeptide (TPR) repeat protein